MSVQSDIEAIRLVVAGVDNNKLARLSYTQTAFDADTVAGVENFDVNAEQNIPLATKTNFNATVLDKGIRTQGSSLPRLAINHFLGRVSYNVNKLIQKFLAWLVVDAAARAHNDQEYDTAAKYLTGDVCYLVDVVSTPHRYTRYRRTSITPTELVNTSPPNGSHWEELPNTEVLTHAAVTSAGVHGSTSAAMVNTVIHRDYLGRAKVGAPGARSDIARKMDAEILAKKNIVLSQCGVNRLINKWISHKAVSAISSWRSVCWSPELSLFAAVAWTGASSRVMTSTNGVQWVSRAAAAANYWASVCWSPALGIFVAVAYAGSGGSVMTSTDGINWTLQTSVSALSWRSVCWSPALGIFVAVASGGTGNRAMTSPDGVTWTIRTSAADNAWYSVCWSTELSLFVAVSNSGTGNRVMTSPDGITWTIRTSAADNSWASVCWSPELGLFVAVADSGTGNRVMTSPDGITWTIRTSAADNSWASVCWSPELGLFVAVNGNNNSAVIMVSRDGIVWATRTAVAVGQTLSSICWSPELCMFVAVDYGGEDIVMTTLPMYV
jgi:hypothetical protein